MEVRYYLAAILFLLMWCSVFAGCDVDDVAVYKMTLRTLWTEDRFPKDYPLFRPKAQWSQVFGQERDLILGMTFLEGQSHNASYHLYQLGDVARESIRQFSQFGKLDPLIEEGDEEARVYDQFSAPAIGKGEGETDNMVFVDGGHSLVSIISRIVPSPDWFIGVDSINLCVDSTWIEQITLDLEPLDAGAASGLTFTAPRWETTPPEPVSRHGPKSPNHAAAGFYYPELRELPAIAKVEFIKVKEYSTKALNDLARKEVAAKMKLNERSGLINTQPEDNEDEYADSSDEEITTKNHIDRLKGLEEEPLGTPRPNLSDNNVEVITKSHRTTTTTTEPEFGVELRSMDEVVLAVAHGRELGLNHHLPRHFRSRLHHAVNKLTTKDCLVSEWGPWTPCSATCGFGDQFRTRRVLRAPALDGRACPELTERTHCGDVNSCYDIQYFDW